MCASYHVLQENDTHGLRIFKDSNQIQKLENFYWSQRNAKTENANMVDEGEPQWSKTLFDPLRNKYLIPVLVTRADSSNSFIAHKYLVISEINKELSGEFVFLLEKMKARSVLSDMELESLILNENFNEETIIAKRGLTSNLPNSNETAKFVKAKVKTIPTQKINGDSTIVSNSVPIADCTASGGTVVEIEWWYQEYDQWGNVTYEEYVYSTHECWGGEGGGGGGGGTATSSSCGSISSEQAILLLNQVQGEEMDEVSYTSVFIAEGDKGPNNTENLAPIRKSVVAKYSFYNLYLTTLGSGDPVTWYANFSGIVYKNSDTDFWKWESINFVNVSKEGNAPICFEYVMTANVAPPIIEPDKKKAQSAVSYSGNIKVCIGGWQMKSFAGSLPTMYLYAQ